ncbi:MAG: isoaspartyl peptidase/L-asparaginase [Desulfurococcales archaeon]|nr:isoaspartyl peptidase/L-asparaginase [Desulfurococcales archaeon]
MRASAEPGVIVHGGAGRWSLVFEITREANLHINQDKIVAGVAEASRRGYRVLEDSGSPVDAVVAAIRYMEDSGLFNAGVGSSLDASGQLGMDAGLMNGSTGEAVGVARVRHPRNPIVLARSLLGKTDHVIIACEPADRLAEKLGLERHPGPSPRALALYKWALREIEEGRMESVWRRNQELARLLGLLGDTVGAVAIDHEGRIAAGVSTGGVSFKLPGRIGDSPVPGAGFYAWSNAGGVAATGRGELALLTQVSARAADLMAELGDPQLSLEKILSLVEDRYGPGLGLIGFNKNGEYGVAYNTEAMPWAYTGGLGDKWGFWRQ